MEILPGYIYLVCGACDFTHEAMDHLDEHVNDDGMADKAKGLIDTFSEILSGKAEPPAAKKKTEVVIGWIASTRRQQFSSSDLGRTE